MYIGGSLLLIVVGAVLRWAVNFHSSVFNIQLAGLIIFIVGIVGLLVSLFWWFSHRGPTVPPGDYPPRRYPGDYPPRDYPPV